MNLGPRILFGTQKARMTFPLWEWSHHLKSIHLVYCVMSLDLYLPNHFLIIRFWSYISEGSIVYTMLCSQQRGSRSTWFKFASVVVMFALVNVLSTKKSVIHEKRIWDAVNILCHWNFPSISEFMKDLSRLIIIPMVAKWLFSNTILFMYFGWHLM